MLGYSLSEILVSKREEKKDEINKAITGLTVSVLISFSETFEGIRSHIFNP